LPASFTRNRVRHHWQVADKNQEDLATAAPLAEASDELRRFTHTQQWRSKMKTLAMKYLGALGLAAVLAMTAVTSSYAQRHDSNCIPQYDTSGAQTAPYC
jgi:hypothetical protein